jgi:hypothetical protein
MSSVKKITTCVCSECEQEVYRCYICTNYLEPGDEIICNGEQHICQACYDDLRSESDVDAYVEKGGVELREQQEWMEE